jgi:hypothetical protein
MIHLPEQSYYTVHDRSIWYLLTMSKMVVGAEKDIPCRCDLLVVIEGRGAPMTKSIARVMTAVRPYN